MKVVISIFLLILVVVVGCDKIDVGKISDRDLERISNKIMVCNEPYIRYGSECCLDTNKNSICDPDEERQDEKEEGTSDDTDSANNKLEKTKENPTENQEVNQNDKQKERKLSCQTNSGLPCSNVIYSSNSIRITLKNGLGYNLNDVSITSTECTAPAKGSLGNGAKQEFVISGCSLPRKAYEGKLQISYTNADSMLPHALEGKIYG